MRIGVDFDNTLACYDRVFAAAAVEAGLAPPDCIQDKAWLGDYIRRLPDGETAWKRLQGQVYGRLIGQAELVEGAAEFLAHCRRRGASVFVVSHKTEFGHFDPHNVPLREAALAWMEERGFFAEGGFAISRGNVFFEATRPDKLARIAALDCDAFVDDLPEVLDDPAFPVGVARYLVGSGQSWKEITDALFPK
jgi:hypothetical protein